MNAVNRRGFLKACAALPFGAGAAGAAVGGVEQKVSAKKGFCTMEEAWAVKLKAKWWYNWGAYGQSRPGLEFVPMVKGTPHFGKAGYWEHVAQLKTKGATHLLGYNEPEREKQGNLSVADGLALWPKLEAAGLPLGSPAPSSDGKGMAWLDEFMKGVEAKKLRVDFLALHWYRSSDAGQLEDWLKGLHKKYKRPLWLTEFNAWNADQRTQERFLRQASRVLERLDFVERWTFFSPGSASPGSLCAQGAEKGLTPLGEFYRDI